jgi:glycosyltransferase involved in cell wall biosynthesis
MDRLPVKRHELIGASMAKLLISIIIPVYNGAKYMREAIDSALNQTWPDIEVIVVNDGSTDNGETERIAKSYGDRIRYVAKSNGGVASALNSGIAAMHGEIFCWLSHDDRYLPEKTERQVAEWTNRGQADAILISDYRLIDASGSTITEVRLDHETLAAKPQYALLRGSIHGCSVFVPRQFFRTVGTFDEGLPTTQDYDLWHRMIRKGAQFVHMPEVLIESRWHDEQGSKKIDHVPEATRFWTKVVDDIPVDEQELLEGSRSRFLEAMADFLKLNNLVDASDNLRLKAQSELSNTLVSIVIPVYNRLEMACSAVESAIAQTHTAIEVIVVDDGSTEEIESLSNIVTHHAPRVQLIRQENRGPAAARNTGWAAARGAYVAFLDADDLFLPNKIWMQLTAMATAGQSLTHTSYFRHLAGKAEFTRMASGAGNTFPAILGGCGIATPTVMLRRSLWDEGFRFPEDFRIGEDIILWIRIAAKYGVSGLDTATTVVRASSGSAAYDRTTQILGVQNVLNVITATPELAKHEVEIAKLVKFLESLKQS